MTQFLKSEVCKHCAECNNRTPLFNVLDREGLNILNRNRNEVRFKAGEIIFKQGMPSHYLISVTSGLVKLYIEGVSNRNLIFEIVKPWNVFGCPGLFLDGRYHYSAAALEDTTTCFIDFENVKELIRTNPDFAEEFIKSFGRKNTRTFERFISLTQKQMAGRIADVLLYLSNDIFESDSFKLVLSRQDLADITSLTKESALRVLKEFQQDNIIHMYNGSIDILNKKKLVEYSVIG